MTDHRYSDDEVHAIFTRAADRQEAAETAKAASEGGLTLAELQEIGSEAGIDPDHVADAARALTLRQSEGAVVQPSNPWEVCESRTLPGVMPDSAWEQTVGELRDAFKRHGTVSQFGGVREWYSGDDTSSRTIELRVEPLGEGIRVTLRHDARSQVRQGYWAISLFGFMTVLLTAIMLAGSFDPKEWVLVGGFGLSTLLGLIGHPLMNKRRMVKQSNLFSAVIDRIELIVRRERVLGAGDDD